MFINTAIWKILLSVDPSFQVLKKKKKKKIIKNLKLNFDIENLANFSNNFSSFKLNLH